MLSATQLERASGAYRSGYHDGYAKKEKRRDFHKGSFADFDYRDGYRAGENDFSWQKHWEGKQYT